MSYLMQDDTLNGIADALRLKTGIDTDIQAEDFEATILSIRTCENTDAAAQSALDAARYADAAKASEVNADSSAKEAALSAYAAAASQTNAATSEVNAKTSEDNAKVSETNAKASEEAAKTSETNAATSEANAKTSEDNAKTSETNAKVSEEAAATSESNAKASEDAADASEANAKASEEAAAASASAAATSEANAATSETNAAESAAIAKLAAETTTGQTSEAWAIGTKGGTPVVEGEDGYNNNSKYWAGVSEEHSISSAASAAESQFSANAASEYAAATQEFYEYHSGELSEAWAIGTMGGEPVTEDRKMYNNNSKYWSLLAKEAAEKAAMNYMTANILVTAVVTE